VFFSAIKVRTASKMDIFTSFVGDLQIKKEDSACLSSQFLKTNGGDLEWELEYHVFVKNLHSEGISGD